MASPIVLPSFGTDGVRGAANTDLTPEVALALGRAAAGVLGGDTFVIGRDPRRSGPMLEAALAAGLASSGASVELLGVVPTPTVAWVCAQRDLPGAMISASHNPFADNGIKLFAAGGLKLADEAEAQIQQRFHAILTGEAASGADADASAVPVAAGVDMKQFFAQFARLAHSETLNAGWQVVKIRVRMSLVPAGVCNIDTSFIWRKDDSVWHGQGFENDLDLARFGIEFIDPVARNLMGSGEAPRRVGKP